MRKLVKFLCLLRGPVFNIALACDHMDCLRSVQRWLHIYILLCRIIGWGGIRDICSIVEFEQDRSLTQTTSSKLSQVQCIWNCQSIDVSGSSPSAEQASQQIPRSGSSYMTSEPVTVSFHKAEASHRPCNMLFRRVFNFVENVQKLKVCTVCEIVTWQINVL